MSKVLLVEDDNNLREIYEARLAAEGYEIASAADGEEALVVAKREKPDLVISDVMMPKISGFEMLDILRNTDGLKDVQVIMLTALGQAEDKTRADQLGANKYLVKSQVTLEDIVKTAHQLLDDESTAPLTTSAPAEAAAAPVPAAPVTAVPVAEPPAAPVAQPVVSAPEPVAAAPAPEPTPAPAVTSIPVAEPPTSPVPSVQETPVATPPVVTLPEPAASAPEAVTPVEVAPEPEPAAAIETPQPAEPAAAAPTTGSAETEAQETAEMQAQIDSFIHNPATAPSDTEATPVANGAPDVPPLPEPTATSVADDKLMHEAVESLIADTESKAVPSDVAAVEVPPTEVEPTPESASAPSPDLATAIKSSSTTSIAGKKVIQPLNDPTDKTDLNKLLAQEEASVTATSTPAAVAATPAAPAAAPAPPADATTPTVPGAPAPAPEATAPETSAAPPVVIPDTPPKFGDSDPNSIAL
jgi:CheY-like chemotaxis protein